MCIRALSAEREDTFYRNCFLLGEHRPEVYAVNVFMALTPFETYGSWTKRANWSGTNGKMALPTNFRDKVQSYVDQRFPELSGDQRHKIRSSINERLRSPCKVDPEMPRDIDTDCVHCVK